MELSRRSFHIPVVESALEPELEVHAKAVEWAGAENMARRRVDLYLASLAGIYWCWEKTVKIGELAALSLGEGHVAVEVFVVVRIGMRSEGLEQEVVPSAASHSLDCCFALHCSLQLPASMVHLVLTLEEVMCQESLYSASERYWRTAKALPGTSQGLHTCLEGKTEEEWLRSVPGSPESPR